MAAVDQREENKKRVIESTIWCFENMGVEQTTRIAIAKQAGVTVRSVQRYFGTLDNLMMEAIGVYMQRLNEYIHLELQRLEDSKATGYELLVAFLRMHLQYFKPDMPSPLVIHEMELYFLKKEIPLITLYQRLFDTKTNTSVMGELFKQGILDGSIKSTADIEVVYAYLVTTFPAMNIRVAMMATAFGHVSTNVTIEMLFDKYIEILDSLIKA